MQFVQYFALSHDNKINFWDMAQGYSIRIGKASSTLYLSIFSVNKCSQKILETFWYLLRHCPEILH
jgi:hypothetical protein